MVPWFPTVVTQPVAPSALHLHFMRIRPDFSSFFAHSRTSTTSPTLSFLVESFSFRALALAPLPSSSKLSVRMVSVITLNTWPPSSRKVVPWLPVTLIQPSSSSFMALAFTRMTLTVSSSCGPCRISTTSPSNNLRKDLLPLISTVDVSTVSLATFMKWRTKLMNLSFEISPSSSSSKVANSLPSSSMVGSEAAPSPSFLASPSSSFLGSFVHMLKKASHSASPILPSLSVSTASNRASLVILFSLWWYLSIWKARFSTRQISSCSFFLPSSRNLAAWAVDLASRASKRPILSSIFFCSPVSQAFSSSSQPSRRLPTVLFADVTSSFASFKSPSASSASVAMSDAPMVFSLAASVCASSSAFFTLASAASASAVASFTSS
mmetsp:Transcript_2268/g.6780  ORF Transcript_2268/g.6780 Transcript_2268/m.6780 type:complete len:380 (+) Transcript_2268:74-1213(+)